MIFAGAFIAVENAGCEPNELLLLPSPELAGVPNENIGLLAVSAGGWSTFFTDELNAETEVADTFCTGPDSAVFGAPNENTGMEDGCPNGDGAGALSLS